MVGFDACSNGIVQSRYFNVLDAAVLDQNLVIARFSSITHCRVPYAKLVWLCADIIDRIDCITRLINDSIYRFPHLKV